MNIATISDLHLGDGSETDKFKLDEDKVINFIQRLISTNDKVVLNGDAFDCWQGKDWEDQVLQFTRVVRAHPKLSAFIIAEVIAGRMIYISGNHDAVVRIKKLIPNVVKEWVYEYEIAGRVTKVLFRHGHQGDIANSKLSFVGRTITWAIAWLERLGWRDADKDLSYAERFLPASSSDLDKYAVHLMESGYRVVALGHTHVAKTMNSLCNERMCRYINSGSMYDGNISLNLISVDEFGMSSVSQTFVTL